MYILSLPNHTHEKLGKGPFCTSDLRVIFTHQPRRPLRLKMAMFTALPNAYQWCAARSRRVWKFKSCQYQNNTNFGDLQIKDIESFPFLAYNDLCTQFLYIIQKVKSQRLPYKDISSHCEALHPNILWPFAKRHKIITISF